MYMYMYMHMNMNMYMWLGDDFGPPLFNMFI